LTFEAFDGLLCLEVIVFEDIGGVDGFPAFDGVGIEVGVF
jgi:hypothetical protein